MSTLIVDDNDDMRSLVRLLVGLTDGLEVVAEAADAAEALAMFEAHHPDVVVLDHRLPDLPGIDVAEQMLEQDPGVSVLLFSAFLDDRAVARAEELGVQCVAKDQVQSIPGLIALGRRDET